MILRERKKSELGKGSFACVQLVTHRLFPQKKFAMKKIQLKNTMIKKCVEWEIKLHKSLIHKNIIKFIDCLKVKDYVLIFLEYAENGDLFRYLQKKKFDEKSLLSFFFQTCKAIKYIHSKDIMHWDLKPENILVNEKEEIKLCDFGYSAEYN